MAIAETAFPIGPRRDGLSNDSRQARSFDPGLAGQITVPTLIVHGTKDRNVSYAQATLAAGSIPHSELVTVRGANHWTTMADPVAQEALHGFLATIASSEPPDS
jgi:pimeloyl-ACP methyl ester carboxylesterase